ncbi:hypothetical protein DFH09DRAFT_1079400 [Mycena vulgaris]|nr:hypothetical protein DFH09DRAFT_1079400 [Mycena vulgaris]
MAVTGRALQVETVAMALLAHELEHIGGISGATRRGGGSRRRGGSGRDRVDGLVTRSLTRAFTGGKEKKSGCASRISEDIEINSGYTAGRPQPVENTLIIPQYSAPCGPAHEIGSWSYPIRQGGSTGPRVVGANFAKYCGRMGAIFMVKRVWKVVRRAAVGGWRMRIRWGNRSCHEGRKTKDVSANVKE